MALIGTGIVPAGPTGAQLEATTRRAFIPKAIVQIYQSTPVLAAGLANAQTASGGVSSITVPVQGAPFVTAQATDFSGSFAQPAVLNGITESDWNLCAIVVPIPFLGMEGILQLSAAVVPLIEARMNDAGNQIADYASTQLWTNATYGGINIDGFPLIANNTGLYGNIDRTPAGNSWWRANVQADTGNPTRNKILNWIISAMAFNGGEMPNFGVTDPGTWSLLAQDFTSLEQYQITPQSSFDQSNAGARSAFTALSVAGVPIYMDPYSPVDQAGKGQFLFFNTRYYSFYIHEAAAFAFTGFASTLPNFQLGYIGALVAVLQDLTVKPKSFTVVSGFNRATI